ncbi:MAG: hypothetical protein ABI741_02640 [Ferruginibacter sp.]
MTEKKPSTVKNDSDISLAERSLLDESIENSMTQVSNNLNRAKLDNIDEDGTPLNEKSSGDDISGSDLDIPGAGDDDEDEEIGEEDEENNHYSQADTE